MNKDDNNKSMLCYNHILGQCSNGKGCHFGSGHAPQAHVGDKTRFVVVRMMVPGIAGGGTAVLVTEWGLLVAEQGLPVAGRRLLAEQ